MAAGLLQMASLNFEPLYYRPHGAGDWSGHVPFAYDLVAALSPSTIVELGTQYGESYFAFCQAVAECGIACKSFAVDTWRGDPHTGAYGEAVFREVSAHNQQHYASFSTLLRTFFDDAQEHFPDGSIGLLHIDGLHTYEAVRHDFDTWFPKVSPGGIILMHDTHIRRSDFGVWRLWEELRVRYESFEFPHSSGLGVIRKPGGKRARSGLASLLFQNEVQAEAVRRFYRISGERLEYKDRAERQGRTGEWELLAQLFWRAAGQEFSEERSIHARGDVTALANEIRLELPRDTSSEQLRVDLLESPAFMRIHAIRLFGPKDERLWSLPTKDIQEHLVCTGLRLTPENNGCSVAAALAGEPRSILLNIPQTALDQLVAGGSLQLEISGLEAGEYAATLNLTLKQYLNRALAAESNLTVSQNEANALTRGLAEAQDLVRKQQAELCTYDRALSEAQRLALERETEAIELTRGLAEAQDLVRKQQAELGTYDRALSEAQRLVSERETEAIALARGLAEAQDLAQKYQSDLSTYDRALKEAQKLASEREAELSDLDNRHRKATEPLDCAERSLADREARILHLTEVLAQSRKELAGREEQLCDSAARLSEARRQAAILEQDSSQAREELERKSASLLEVERLYDECSRRLREIETSLSWRLTRPLRSLPRF